MPRSALLLVVLVTACASGAYERGRAKAEADIAAGQPALLFLGLPSAERSALDPSTGLPEWTAGCVVSEERLAYVDGYNDATLEALRSGRLEGMTLGHKPTTWEAVAARFRDEEPARLRLGAPPGDRGCPLSLPLFSILLLLDNSGRRCFRSRNQGPMGTASNPHGSACGGPPCVGGHRFAHRGGAEESRVPCASHPRGSRGGTRRPRRAEGLT